MSGQRVAESSVWTQKELIERTAEYLQGKGVPTPRLDAELLLAHVLNCTRIQLYLNYDRPLSTEELDAYRELVRARGDRRPLAYLTGEVGFWDLDLFVDPGVLIPSPDTETLVEGILEGIKAIRQQLGAEAPVLVLELGSGSGAIPLAVCSAERGITWIGIERSEAAMRVAVRNRKRHEAVQAPRNNRLLLVLGDRFEPVHPGWQPHLVVGNPPYIPTGTIDRLMPEVAKGEPRLALDGGGDGTRFQRYMMAYAATRMALGGRLLFEMGAEQERQLRQILGGHPELRALPVRKDLSGHPRVLQAERLNPAPSVG